MSLSTNLDRNSAANFGLPSLTSHHSAGALSARPSSRFCARSRFESRFMGHSSTLSSTRDFNDNYRNAQGLGVDPNIRGLRGSIGSQGDRRDWYKFAVTGVKAVNIELRRLDQDVDLYLYRPIDLSNPIAQSRRGGRLGESITTPLRAGTYYIKLEAFRGARSEYRLSLLTRG
jgi:hypothetical protein